ncbi:MAG: alanine racemase, partial [Campylobacterales bacterium]|nr:alanine racemase [Campylobacterales bacterium]
MAYITLNKNNFFNNLNIISKQTKSKDKIALVLKDNAYGHGILEVSSMAREYGITKAVVRCQVEADMVQDYFDYILVLSDFPKHQNDKMRYTINDIAAIKKFPNGCKVELKVDTGMHRNGVAMDEVLEAIVAIKDAGLILEAVFTHHRSADELSSEWFWQNENFKKVKEICKDMGLRFHSANSASLFRTESFSEDMARVGIAAYGCMESLGLNGEDELKPVLSLYAQKNSQRVLKKGSKVGYGGTHTLKEDATISNYDFGYGDGFLRISSDNYTTPKGDKLVGRISMDNSSFLSDADEILVFNDARVLAKSSQT